MARAQAVHFEKERGITDVTARGSVAHVSVSLGTRAISLARLALLGRFAQAQVPVFLVKLLPDGISFALRESAVEAGAQLLREMGVSHTMTRDLSLLTVHAGAMRDLSGVMASIYETLVTSGAQVIQTGDAYNAVHCLVPGEHTDQAAQALCVRFGLNEPSEEMVPSVPPSSTVPPQKASAARILVQKFGGTSVDSEEHRQMAAGKVIRALQAGWKVVVVVSAIGRKGAPYATDTLLSQLREVDPTVAPAPRETDLLVACGEIISTVILAQTLRARGVDTIALTGGQAGIATDYEFGNARILSIDPSYIVRSLDAGKVVLVAGFQGATEYGAITTLGRGGSDTTASALGAALKNYASEVSVEIYTDVNGVKTADPRLVSDACSLPQATYEQVAEMAHQGAKVVHPRAAEIAHLHGIPLWVKSTFDNEAGTLITADEKLGENVRRRVTGVTHTGKIAYLRFAVPGDCAEADKGKIELEVYRILQQAGVPLYLNSTDGPSFSFAVAREHLSQIRDALDGLVVPLAGTDGCGPGEARALAPGRAYLLGLGDGSAAFETQKRLLVRLGETLPVREVRAQITENCTVISVIASQFRGVPGVMALILESLHHAGVPVYQTADSEYSISVLIPEADAPQAARTLHSVFRLAQAGSGDTDGIK